MISVIVPYAGDQTYLIRCVNSVMRQTYKDIEIIIITAQKELPEELKNQSSIIFVKEENKSPYVGIDEAIQRAKGEYIFFNYISSVPAPNTFSALLENVEENPSTFYSGGLFLPSEEEYILAGETSLSWCGKLFRRDLIIESQIVVDEASKLTELLFVSEYAKHYESYKTDSEIYIYETQEDFPNREWNDVDEADWEAMLLHTSKLPSSVAHEMAHGLAQLFQRNNSIFDEMLWLAEQNLHDCYELNLVLARPFLQQWWSAVTEKKDTEKFELLKKYLCEYEDHLDFLNLLLEPMGLSYKQYPYLFYENLDDSLCLIENSCEDIGKQTELEETICSIKRELDELKQSLGAHPTSPPHVPVEMVADGAGAGGHILDLEDHIIKESREGRVGIRTIWKFFKGWASFKIHRGARGQENG